ncbi:MAG TPA: response regulator [Blastocatellia bacterium]|jgi:two-component system chemotaxis response regulator CheY
MAKILVVDDSGMSRRTLRKILEPAGHEIIEAEEGMVALERYTLDKPDLVLLDLTMTGMYGIDVLKKLREMDPQASVIVASADIQRSTLEMVEAGGASAFINKPFTSDKVRSTVESVLQGKADAT